MRFQQGQLIAERYRVENLIGSGSGAEVYKVWDEKRSTHLALKLLKEELSLDGEFLIRFREEAESLSLLQHPNIVRFYELVQKENMVFFLMDFVDGITLRQQFRETQTIYGLDKALSMLKPICIALNYAHQQGVIHCDVKPENILIDKNGHVYLSDFGIALNQGTDGNYKSGVGTPAYMSPEQIQTNKVLPQSDIYAVGIILYEMLTRNKPFTGKNAPQYLSQSDQIQWEQINKVALPPSRLNGNLSEGIDLIVQKCLEKNPYKRFSDSLALLKALEDVRTTQITNAPTNVAVIDNARKKSLRVEKLLVDRKLKKYFPVVAIGIVLIILVFAIGNYTDGGEVHSTLIASAGPNTYSYPTGCMEIVFEIQPKTSLYECVSSITVHPDGSLQVNLEWKVSSLSSTRGITVYPDTGNQNMYLVDNLGNRLDHISTGADANREITLYNGDTKQGWFLFPSADPSATSFYFVDDDNHVRSSRLDRQWP